MYLSNFAFHFNIVLTILGCLHFHVNFRISLLISIKKMLLGIFIRYTLNLYWVFCLWAWYIHHLFGSFQRTDLRHISWNVFLSTLGYYCNRYFSISISNCSLLVYRNIIDFYILALYSATLLTSLIILVISL